MDTPQIQTTEELRADLLRKANDDPEFRGRLLADPGAALEAEYGVVIPKGFTLEVHEESATHRHVVLPASDELTQEELEAIAAGHTLSDTCSC